MAGKLNPQPQAGWLRWVARGLGGLIVAFSLWMIVGHLTGDAGRATRTLVTGDYVGMVMLGVALAGLVIAWWREAAGATITLLAIAIASSLNWRILVSPFALFPVAAALHLLNARLSAGSQRRT